MAEKVHPAAYLEAIGRSNRVFYPSKTLPPLHSTRSSESNQPVPTLNALPRRSHDSTDFDGEAVAIIAKERLGLPYELTVDIQQLLDLSDELMPIMITTMGANPAERYKLIDLDKPVISLSTYTVEPSIVLSFKQSSTSHGHWRLESGFHIDESWVAKFITTKKPEIQTETVYKAILKGLHADLHDRYPRIFHRTHMLLPPIAEYHTLAEGTVTEYRVVKPLYLSDFLLYPNELLPHLVKVVSFLMGEDDFSRSAGILDTENHAIIKRTVGYLQNFRKNKQK